MQYNRRDFIKTVGAFYGSLLLVPACSSGTPAYRVFTGEEASCLIALCEQVIPADHDPGATDAGVIHFIDKQTDLRFPGDMPLYRAGIKALQETCMEKYGNLFELLPAPVQVEVMKDMEGNRLPGKYWEGTGQSSFFNLVLRRTMQGFYGSPRHGGNRNYVSYRMMKLDYPLLVGQNRYRNEK